MQDYPFALDYNNMKRNVNPILRRFSPPGRTAFTSQEIVVNAHIDNYLLFLYTYFPALI